MTDKGLAKLGWRGSSTARPRLGMETVAEGVATEEQLQLVRASGCDKIRGYIFSRPVSSTAVKAMLRQGRKLRRGPGVASCDRSAEAGTSLRRQRAAAKDAALRL